MQITAKQHFVPRFYLKAFSDQGNIKILDLRAKRIAKPRSYASVCYDRFFYAVRTGIKDDVSQDFEKFFGSYEDRIAKYLPDVIEHARGQSLTDDDFDILAYFMSTQWMRTVYFRNQLNRMQEDVTKKMMAMTISPERIKRVFAGFGQELSDPEAMELAEVVKEEKYSVQFTNIVHLRFMNQKEIEGFHNLFFHKQWNVLTTTGQYRFITSDNPVSEWIPPRTGFFGATFFDRKHYLALAPDIMIENVYSDRDSLKQPPSTSVEYKAINDDEVIMHGMVTATHSNEFCYAYSDAEFSEILRQLKTPSKAMQLFAQRYPLDS